MKKRLVFKIVLLILLSMCQTSSAREKVGFPEWINELGLNIGRTLHTEVVISNTNIPDHLKQGIYFEFDLKGEGSLEKVPDPFQATHKMFASEGWVYIPEYQADKQGGSSFAYAKGGYFCNIFIDTDSSCDDEETGHIPAIFRFEIYCRKK